MKTLNNKSSDIRFKNDICFTKTVKDVNFYTWEWNDFYYAYHDKEESKEGVIAQELIHVYPHLVMIDDNGYMSVDYTNLFIELGV